MIGEQLVERIRFMHSKNFLHRDIKPDNMLMGVGKKAHIMYLVDYGLAKKFIKEGKSNLNVGKHILYKEGK
jgi:casein kinase 1